MESKPEVARTHGSLCDCQHTACKQLKEQFLCHRWYLFRCGGPLPEEPGTMVRALRRSFGFENDVMRLYGVRMVDGMLCFLVKFAEHGLVPANLPTHTQECMRHFNRRFMAEPHARIGWTPLGCCEEQLRFNGRDWLDTFDFRPNAPCFGDSQVLSSFREDVRPYLT